MFLSLIPLGNLGLGLRVIDFFSIRMSLKSLIRDSMARLISRGVFTSINLHADCQFIDSEKLAFLREALANEIPVSNGHAYFMERGILIEGVLYRGRGFPGETLLKAQRSFPETHYTSRQMRSRHIAAHNTM